MVLEVDDAAVPWVDNPICRRVLIFGVMNLGMGALVTSIAPLIGAVNPALYEAVGPPFLVAMAVATALGMFVLAVGLRAVLVALLRAPRRYAITAEAIIIEASKTRRVIGMSGIHHAERRRSLFLGPCTAIAMRSGEVHRVPSFYPDDDERFMELVRAR